LEYGNTETNTYYRSLNKCALTLNLKLVIEGDRLMFMGNIFHFFGAAASKHLSPNVFRRVVGTGMLY
jgi:hypothetical protein